MPHAIPTQDRRAFGRRVSCIRALLHIAGRPTLHCIVRNYSEGGALLDLPEPVETSAPVRLVIEAYGVDVVCEVRHSREATMGVRFLSAVEVDWLTGATGETLAPMPEPMTGLELRKKLFGPDPAAESVLTRRYSTQTGPHTRHA